jgi:hypothetical protein
VNHEEINQISSTDVNENLVPPDEPEQTIAIEATTSIIPEPKATISIESVPISIPEAKKTISIEAATTIIKEKEIAVQNPPARSLKLPIT